MPVKYSIIGSAIREHLYRDVYKNINSNCGDPFEIIFVGNKSPVESFPENFKYIHTEVKPVQCLEIAAREAKGDFLFIHSDDTRVSLNFFKRLSYYILRFDMNRTFFSFLFCINGKHRNNGLVFDKAICNSPVIGVSGLFRRDVWMKLGGLDRRFYGWMADIDMQTRFFEYGMHLFIPPDCYCNELKKGRLMRNRRKARGILNSFWVDENNNFSRKRLLPVKPFDDENILTADQW